MRVKDINMPLDEFITNIVKTAMKEVRLEQEKVEDDKTDNPDIKILKEIPNKKLSGLITKVYDKFGKDITRVINAKYKVYEYGTKKIINSLLIETTGKWDRRYGTIVNSGLLNVLTNTTTMEVNFGLSRSVSRIFKKKKKIYIEFLGDDLDAVTVAFALGVIHKKEINAYDILVDYIQCGFKIDLEHIDFIGYEKVIDKCNNILRCEDDRVANRHIMLYGAPGNGKSMLAKKIASENPQYIPITINVQCRWEKWIPMLSELIKKTNKKLLVVFDEIDELGLDRDRNRDRVYELLRLLDGTTDLKNIKFIATTNRPQDLDVALLRVGRFSPMHIKPPNTKQRKQIITYYFNKYDFEDIDIDKIINRIPKKSSGAVLRGCIEDCIINNQSPTEDLIIRNLENNMSELEKISDISDVMYS